MVPPTPPLRPRIHQSPDPTFCCQRSSRHDSGHEVRNLWPGHANRAASYTIGTYFTSQVIVYYSPHRRPQTTPLETTGPTHYSKLFHHAPRTKIPRPRRRRGAGREAGIRDRRAHPTSPETGPNYCRKRTHDGYFSWDRQAAWSVAVLVARVCYLGGCHAIAHRHP